MARPVDSDERNLPSLLHLSVDNVVDRRNINKSRTIELRSLSLVSNNLTAEPVTAGPKLAWKTYKLERISELITSIPSIKHDSAVLLDRFSECFIRPHLPIVVARCGGSFGNGI
jgi:hypothetical protein